VQFGFKKTLGCSHALFALRQCVNYFISRGSSLFMAALDAKNAFDRVHHVKLLHRLCNIGVPLQVVRLIENWYSKIIMKVKWENCYSSSCIVREVRRCAVTGPFQRLFQCHCKLSITQN